MLRFLLITSCAMAMALSFAPPAHAATQKNKKVSRQQKPKNRGGLGIRAHLGKYARGIGSKVFSRFRRKSTTQPRRERGKPNAQGTVLASRRYQNTDGSRSIQNGRKGLEPDTVIAAIEAEFRGTSFEKFTEWGRGNEAVVLYAESKASPGISNLYRVDAKGAVQLVEVGDMGAGLETLLKLKLGEKMRFSSREFAGRAQGRKLDVPATNGLVYRHVRLSREKGTLKLKEVPIPMSNKRARKILAEKTGLNFKRVKTVSNEINGLVDVLVETEDGQIRTYLVDGRPGQIDIVELRNDRIIERAMQHAESAADNGGFDRGRAVRDGVRWIHGTSLMVPIRRGSTTANILVDLDTTEAVQVAARR
jgi:hypothetical protein